MRLLPALLSLPVLAQSAPQAPAVPADLDAVVAKAMAEFQIPGMAVAIVKDGKVALAKGYGVRRMGEPGKVDADTIFGIASNTKAFNAATAALLVQDGKLKWDDKVIQHLPSFRVGDPFVTNELTVRDLFCHRTGLGLGQGDLMLWPDTTFSRDEVLASAAFLKPQSSLRSRYAYNNLTFLVAGELVGRVAGKPWEQLVAERLFQPLGMHASTISRDGLKGLQNVASPHSRGWRADQPLAPTYVTRDQVWAGAAGVKSNLTDLSKWVAMLLNGGKLPDGKALLTEASLQEMWSVQTPLRVGKAPAGFEEVAPDFAGYGLGWRLSQYRGRKTVGHGGALTGMVSLIQMVPSLNLGVIILTNQEESLAMNAVLNRILDQAMGAPSKDWVAVYRKQRDEQLAKAKAAAAKAEAERVKGAPPVALAAYAGKYRDAWYGEVRIEQEGQGLVLQMGKTPAMRADLSPWQFETFKAVFCDPNVPDAFVTFQRDAEGRIERVKMVPTSDLADFSFDYQDLDLRPVK
jgi:CubicO group peptidase (beta-lactamase class C family)